MRKSMVGLKNHKQLGMVGPSVAGKKMMGDDAGKWVELDKRRLNEKM